MKNFEWRGPNSQFLKFRQPLIFLLALMCPVVALLFLRKVKTWSPVLSFLVVSSWSLLVGISLHALECTPDALFGLDPLRGIKLLLVGPLFIGLWILLTKEEKIQLWNFPLKIKHVFWCGGVLLALGGIYLMRSGNFPLLRVSDSERMIRDGLEAFLGARPRFKEFFFAHPLLVMGLVLQKESKPSVGFFRDGRFFLLIGLIGQISILNTFLHVHTPLEFGVLRTVHGMWLGLLVAIPVSAFFHKMFPMKVPV